MANKGQAPDPKTHVFNPQGRHAVPDPAFDAQAVYEGDNAVSTYNTILIKIIIIDD